MARPDGLVVARTSFFSGKRLVQAGEVWAGDDPIVAHYPTGFRPLVIQASESDKPVRRVLRRTRSASA